MSIERYYKVPIAKKYGIGEAIFIHNLAFWIKKNQANNRHYYRGYFWIYNSYKAFAKQFEEFSKSQIETIIKNLINKKVILKDIISEREDNTSSHINYYTICDKEILKLYEIEYNEDDIEKQKPEEEIKNTENNNNNFDNYTSEKSDTFSEKSDTFSEKSDTFSEKSDTTDTITYTNTYTNIYTSPERESIYARAPSCDFEKFITDFLVYYQKLTGHAVSDINQAPFFRSLKNREELKSIFEARRYNYKQCLKFAFEFAEKRPPDKRFFSFWDTLKVYLQNGNGGEIARYLSEAERQARLEAEKQKAEAEKNADIEKRRKEYNEAERIGLTVEEYRRMLEVESDNIINDLKNNLFKDRTV